MNRRGAALISIAMIGATLSPLLRAPWDDSFPLSTYPMFAIARPATLTMDYALGVTRSGERRYLSPALVGSGEVLQAYIVFVQADERGQLPALCRAIAARVAVAGDQGDVIAIRIVSGTHDAIAYLVDGAVGPEVERARCEVAR